MFEPLPALIRMARAQQNLTQAQLARRAGVSRGRLAALESGNENITLALLVKLATALNLDEPRVGNLRVRAAPPDLIVFIEACNAIIAARKVVDAAASAKAALARITEKFKQAVANTVPSIDADGVDAYIERLRSEQAEKGAAIAPAAAVATPVPASTRPKARTKTGTKRG